MDGKKIEENEIKHYNKRIRNECNLEQEFRVKRKKKKF